jgi:hypothetical protein
MLVGGILDSKVDIYAFGMTCYVSFIFSTSRLWVYLNAPSTFPGGMANILRVRYEHPVIPFL